MTSPKHYPPGALWGSIVLQQSGISMTSESNFNFKLFLFNTVILLFPNYSFCLYMHISFFNRHLIFWFYFMTVSMWQIQIFQIWHSLTFQLKNVRVEFYNYLTFIHGWWVKLIQINLYLKSSLSYFLNGRYFLLYYWLYIYFLLHCCFSVILHKWLS